jgi:hypothetical protein
MASIRVRIEQGKIVGEAPPGFQEGDELELSITDPGDDMTEAELARLNCALEDAWRAVQAGRVRPAEELLDELQSEG